mgnify:CR=1 FL=1
MQVRSTIPAVLVALVVLVGCGSDAGTDGGDGAATMVPVTTAVSTTELTTTVPATAVVSTTAAVTTSLVTTDVSTTQLSTTVPTTAAPTTLAPTTTVAATAPCDLATIVEQTNTAYDDVTPTNLRCADDWASWVGQPNDATMSDGFFAVAQWDGTAWALANLGTAGICGDGGVPAPVAKSIVVKARPAPTAAT